MAQRPGRVLVSRAEIAARVAELGLAIGREHGQRTPLLVGVLNGAAIFMADLIRAIPVPVAVDFVGVSSYGSATRSSGVVRLTADLSSSIEGRNVILVEDVVDSGRTADYHRRNLQVCTLLDKVERRQVEVPLDYVGFAIPDRFVVGYGFDVDGLYRNLPEIHDLEE